MRYLLKLKTLLVIAAVTISLFMASIQTLAAPALTCDLFDTWFLSDGGSKFLYAVNPEFSMDEHKIVNDWNLPPDAVMLSSVTPQNTSIEEYVSDEQQAKYFIVYLSLEPSGDPLGQHDICVYRVPYVQ